MADAARLEEWDRFANLIACIRAVHGDKSAHPDKFNPYRNRNVKTKKITAREIGAMLGGKSP